MEFKKYSTIENSYRTKFLEKLAQEALSGGEWAVQEKIHGSNMAFYVSADEIKVAKRTMFVGEDEKFYNSDAVYDMYQARLRVLFDKVNAVEPVDVIQITGELYGGAYPHPDVPDSNQSAVQKHVYYAPHQDFIAFDIKIDGNYVDLDYFTQLCSNYNIPFLETLFRGTLEECLEYDNAFQSKLYLEHNLPVLEDNVCEGVVVRPVKPAFLSGGSRVILKNKNALFSEKSGKAAGPKQEKEAVVLKPEVQVLVDSAGEYINENRLRNVLSHIGTVTDKDFGKIMGLFTKDVIEDFMKDEGEAFNDLPKADRKTITKRVGNQGAALIRANFLNIVDGAF